MKNLFATLLLLVLTTIVYGQRKPMLINRCTSDYCIVLPNQPTALEQYAADELAEMLRLAAASTTPIIPIIHEADYKVAKPAFFIGKCQTNSKLFATTSLRHDGFTLRKVGNNLHLLGYNDTATCYAVYHFVEQGLGCHLYTPTALSVKQTKELTLPAFNCVEHPSFDYREVLYHYPNVSQRYALWHHLHTRKDMQQQWGMFVHTFNTLLPTDKYFNSHPEWYSEINGKRVRDGQLCLTNNEVLNMVCLNLEQAIRKNPDAKIWSVSNNDNINNCTCPKCRLADSLYGGPSGTLIHFINQVAERFPNKTISTLAYQYTRQAPQNPNVKPASNVNVMFCSIESGREAPITTAKGESSFRRDMEQWSALTNNIFLWDYVVQFRNFWNPFPNLHVLQPNLQFFHQHGVRKMFEQASGEENKTSWMELRTYLIAKLMWNVNQNIDSLTHTFCEGYYSAAAPYIEQIISEMTQALVASGQRLDIYGYSIHGKDNYLSPEHLDHYQALIDTAYTAIEGYTHPIPQEHNLYTYRDRIRYFELALDYAIIELSASDLSPTYTFFLTDSTHQRHLNTAMVERLDRFVQDCHRFGIHNLHEMGYTPEEFQENINKYLYKCETAHSLSYGKPVTLAHNYDSRYSAKGEKSLTDGIAGILNYNYNWLGFYDTDFDAVIDLEKQQPIKEISIDFYFFPLSWIFLPQEVVFYVSNNGRSWREVYRNKGNNEPILAKPNITTFHTNGLKTNARYVRIVGKQIPSIPAWHRAVGNPAWLFTDEIVIH